MGIQQLGIAAKDSFKYLKKLQDGDVELIKTGYNFIDDHIGGLLKNDIVVVSGLSGHGKSELLFRLRENILDTEINPSADDFVWLNYNLEVKIFNVILRGLNRRLRKKKKEILFNAFSEDEKTVVKTYFEELEDKRQYVNQDSVTSEEFYTTCRVFLENNRDKEACHISFDHVALVGDSDTSKGIEKLIAYINKLKLEFDNSYFYAISQLNRNILARVNEKDNRAAPNAGDLYASSSMDFISSYNIVVFNAYKLGIEQFLKVNPDRYDYLSEHFGEEDSKGRVSFNTMGKLFYKVIKTRESDEPWKDWYIEDMDISKNDLEKMKTDTQIEQETAPVFTGGMPNFGTSTFDTEDNEDPF